jgi:predicted TIM-barrel fold metal-dependent hydrolase
MNNDTSGTDEWLAQVQEEIIDPDRPIIDPHHHLWRERRGRNYLLEDLWVDTGSGHNIVKTVFIECRAEYREEGPDHLRCLGETDFVVDQAKQSEADDHQATIAGIVGRVDLRLGEAAREVL